MNENNGLNIYNKKKCVWIVIKRNGTKYKFFFIYELHIFVENIQTAVRDFANKLILNRLQTRPRFQVSN